SRASSLDINEVVTETIALTRGEIVKNAVSIETELAGDLPSIRGDRVQLQQVIMNLVMNAVEAMSNVAVLRWLLLGQCTDPVDHLADSPPVFDDVIKRFEGPVQVRGLGPEQAQRGMGVGDQRPNGLVDLMRDRHRQLTDGCDAVCVRELGLGLTQLF